MDCHSMSTFFSQSTRVSIFRGWANEFAEICIPLSAKHCFRITTNQRFDDSSMKHRRREESANYHRKRNQRDESMTRTNGLILIFD